MNFTFTDKNGNTRKFEIGYFSLIVVAEALSLIVSSLMKKDSK